MAEPGNDSENPLAEAAEKIRREAYASGWRDAVNALQVAADHAVQGAPIDMSFTPIGGNSSGLTVGSTPWYVWQAVKKKPGMTGSEVVSVVVDGGHKVSEGSIRTSLSRLKERKLIVARHGKWFPA